MSDSSHEAIQRIRQRFQQVDRELQVLQDKVHQQQGLLFRSHVYSIEALLASPHHERIDTLTRLIGDHAQHWYAAGQLSEDGHWLYTEQKGEVLGQLAVLNWEIRHRQPTWWEAMREVLGDFVLRVQDNMPELVRTLLGHWAARLGRHRLSAPLKRLGRD